MKLYGMTNCMKTLKAIEWLSANGITFKFLDIRKVGIEEDKILEWAEKAGFCTFLNKQIPTWTHLYPKEKMLALNEKYAIRLMCQKPALVKAQLLNMAKSFCLASTNNHGSRTLEEMIIQQPPEMSVLQSLKCFK